MKVKSLLAVIVTNIFLTLLASLFLEYANLSGRFRDVEDTFQTAVDASVVVATGSEEMFADNAGENSTFISGALSKDGLNSSRVFSTTLLWRDNNWWQINSYALAEYYDKYGHLPNNAHEMNVLLAGDTATHYFEFLYGQAGSDYNNSSLSWADTNRRTQDAYSSTPTRSNTYNTEFYDYYRNIGRYQQTAGYVKRSDGDGSYILTLETYPTLYSMGFEWMSQTMNNGNDGYREGWTGTTSPVTADTFSSSVKVGKRWAHGYSNYFLTPMSLGVTYVPTQVLKPVLMANLETMVRLKNLAGVASNDNVEDVLNAADYCTNTSVYDNSPASKQHNIGSSEKIITDGEVEWDLNSLQIKVDYFYVDFIWGDQSKAKTLISKLNGCISAEEYYRNFNGGVGTYGATPSVSQTVLGQETLKRFQDEDSAKSTMDSAYVSAYNGVRGGRIIARVSARVKVHVPYKSSILQWFCERGVDPGHYSVKFWNGANLEQNKDGLWYQYTTYFMQSRS